MQIVSLMLINKICLGNVGLLVCLDAAVNSVCRTGAVCHFTFDSFSSALEQV